MLILELQHAVDSERLSQAALQLWYDVRRRGLEEDPSRVHHERVHGAEEGEAEEEGDDGVGDVGVAGKRRNEKREVSKKNGGSSGLDVFDRIACIK